MPFIPAVNTAKVVVVQRLHGQVVQNTLFFQKATAWDAVGLTALCNLVITWWNDHLANDLHADMTLQAVQARDMTTDEAAGVEIAAPPGSGGNNVTSGGMPGNVALAVKFISGLTGPNRRGRNFISGFSEEHINGNTITDARRDAVVGDFGYLRDAAVAAGYKHVVASFYNGTELRLLPNGETRRKPVARDTALLTEIVQYTADTNLDSQRRRLAGRGV